MLKICIIAFQISQLSAAALAPSVLAGPVAAKARAKVQANFERAPLTKAIKWFAKKTGHNFIVADKLLDKRITIISGSLVTIAEAYRAFEIALEVEGLSIEPKGEFLVIKRKPPRYESTRETSVSVSSRPELSPETGIEQIDDTHWLIPRSEIDGWLNNLNSVAMHARIVPSFKNGEPNGFKLFAIRPHSIYSKLGIKNGDIIHKINGFSISSPDRALEIYQKLRDAKTIDIELSRRGQLMKLNYRID